MAAGTKDDPWLLKTAPGLAELTHDARYNQVRSIP